jgi:3-isopropylmalate/(R)-2-methylmalate dehydratase small subunit
VQPFVTLTAGAVALELINVNTDQIFPARFIKKPRAGGYGEYLFRDLRFYDDGSEKPDFPLNRPAGREAKILVSGGNFGCGSSREGAVYALHDYGFRAAIAPSFGDIFSANCIQNGFLPIVFSEDIVARMRAQIVETPDAAMTVDLPNQIVTAPDGSRHEFEIDTHSKNCLIGGWDDVALTLQREQEIAAFESRYRRECDWLY